MNALIYKKRRGVKLVRDYPPPEPERGEALVRVRLAGICDTDIEITRGYMGYEGVMGHEFVGEVVESADPSSPAGRRVVGEINCPCGKCRTCRARLENHCPHRTVLGILNRDGCFAEYLTLPEENLHPVPDGVPDEEAVFVEPLAAACRILEQVKPGRSDRIAVLGDGKLGLLVAMVLAGKYEKRVYAIGHHKSKLDLLKNTRARRMLERKVGDDRFDIVVDCTGNPDGFRRAMALTSPCGILVLKSTFASSKPLNLAPAVVDEITIVGSRCGPFDRALGLLAQGKIDPAPMINGVFDLEDGVRAIKYAQKKGVVKVLLRMK